MKTKIYQVQGLRVNDIFNIKGINYIVTYFPSRTSVCGKNQKPQSGEPNEIKVPRSDINFYYSNKKQTTILA